MAAKAAEAVLRTAQPAEAALLERLRAGDRDACEEVVRQHQRAIFLLALRYTGSEEEAMDLSQRTFLKVLEEVRSFRGESSLRTWIYRIALNLSLDALVRRGRVPPSMATPSMPATGMERLLRTEKTARLRAAIERLPARQRMVVELRVFDDLPFKEVAQVARCSEDAARASFHHALRRLRALLDGEAG